MQTNTILPNPSLLFKSRGDREAALINAIPITFLLRTRRCLYWQTFDEVFVPEVVSVSLADPRRARLSSLPFDA